MGHRANFVTIQTNCAKAYYDQWAALGCIHAFATGPTEAFNALSEMETTSELMDWAFAEGGYLLDFDQKVAIVFGSPFDADEFGDFEDKFSIPTDPVCEAFEQGIPAFLAYVSAAWTGWKIVWDDCGVDAFAAHLKARNITSIAVQPESYPPETTPPIVFQA